MVHLAQENSAGHLERLVSRYEPVPEPGLEGLLVIKALQAVARPLAEERQEAWQAKQKARMQAVARKLLQRNGTSTDAITEGGVRQADTAVGAAGGASPGKASENSAGEAIPNHLERGPECCEDGFVAGNRAGRPISAVAAFDVLHRSRAN